MYVKQQVCVFHPLTNIDPSTYGTPPINYHNEGHDNDHRNTVVILNVEFLTKKTDKKSLYFYTTQYSSWRRPAATPATATLATDWKHRSAWQGYSPSPG